MKIPDWRSRASSQMTKAGHIPAPKHGGSPKYGKSTVQGKTKPSGDLQGRSNVNDVKLGAYTHRRVRHGSK